MQRRSPYRSAFFNLCILIALVVLLTGVFVTLFATPDPWETFSQRRLTFAERVAYQRAIEDVYWRHRIWPKENPDPKPPLDVVISQAQIEKKVADYMRNSQALEDYWQRPLTAPQLQAEVDRIAQHTKQPEVLRELFEALGNDPFVIAECLARPVLSERLARNFNSHDQRFCGEPGRQPRPDLRASGTDRQINLMGGSSGNYRLPKIADESGTCVVDTWTDTSTSNVASSRSGHTVVWTGSEMIIWGGEDASYLNTGAKYNPATDSWTATSSTNVPDARAFDTAVWTGDEMIVWGGVGSSGFLNSGGRYNPSTDSWTVTSTTNAPDPRESHTAVWAGREMIVWGGEDTIDYFNSGGKYNPGTDSWTATSMINAPEGRSLHTAVWTGSEMIVWGGVDLGTILNTGGRYAPSTGNWTATSMINAPDARANHTAVWTGTEMIIWGGGAGDLLNTGGRYNPALATWATTSIAPDPRAITQQCGLVAK